MIRVKNPGDFHILGLGFTVGWYIQFHSHLWGQTPIVCLILRRLELEVPPVLDIIGDQKLDWF